MTTLARAGRSTPLSGYPEEVAVVEDLVLQRYLANPPVVEAVAGISFRARSFDVVGLVRETSKWASDYPLVTPQPPLPPDGPLGQPRSAFEMQLVQGMGPSRLWSTSEDQTWLVQTQEDRLIVNWRKVYPESSYPGFDPLRERLARLHAELDRPAGSELAPLVAEFTYVNQIVADGDGLHSVYSMFQKPQHGIPGHIIAERYEAVSGFDTDHGAGQLNVVIQPIPGMEPSTTLTVSTKVFAGRELQERDFVALIETAHAYSKKAFFAVVLESATSRWEGP